jgi:hypothetical protein
LPGGRPAFCLGTQLGRPPPEVLDHRVDLRTGLPQPFADLRVEACPKRVLAVAQAFLPDPQARFVTRNLLALARHQPALVFEHLQLVVHLRQMFGELRFARAPVAAGAVHDVRGHAKPLRDFQREAAAGGAVRQAIRGSEGLGVESEPGVDDPRRGRGEGLERVVVGRRHDERTPRPEALDDRHAEGAALRRVRPRAQLVEQDERRLGQLAIHRDDVRDVSGERAEAGRD